MEKSLTIERDAVALVWSERTAGFSGSYGYLAPTGEGSLVLPAIVAQPMVRRRPLEKEQNGHLVPARALEVRAALRVHWSAALAAAKRMLDAAGIKDGMGLGIAADDLDQTLAQLWALREHRDIDWRTILNHLQGMMRQFFADKRVESLTPDQCKGIYSAVADHLGPATKSVDNLNEVVRLIEDAGFDPYAAISDVG